MKYKKVITPDNLGKGITFNPSTKQWEVQSGFDCASFDSLPEKPWKKGTTLLAKQNGECIRLAALDSIFQEIGVGISADKTSAFTGETYDVTVTVTNTGESKNDLTNLTVQKPLLGNYEILDVRTSKQGLDEVERLDDLNYNLKGLAKGGTFILRFSVKANDVGTYQFTATVNPNTALDQNAKNNTDTIILKSNTKIDTTYAPSVDCPRITATELDSNTQLAMLIPTPFGNELYISTATGNNGWNIFANRESLQNLRIRLDGASTVTLIKFERGEARAIHLSNGKLSHSMNAVGGNQSLSATSSILHRGVVGHTFQDGILEITESIEGTIILCRPAGKNCRWQALGITSASSPVESGISVTDMVGGKITSSYNTINGDDRVINIIPSSIKDIGARNYTTHTKKNPASLSRKIIFKVKSGTPASFNYTVVGDGVRLPITSGKTTITENRVTVAADATSTDSINSEYLQVIVED